MSATVGAGSSPVPLTENEVAGAGDTRYANIKTPTPGEIFGLTMSTAGSSTTLSVAAGICADSTNVLRMKLTSLRAKTTSAWAAGTAAGGLDTGSIANSTWYHWYVISNAAGTLVDVIFSTSPNNPALPGGYTLYRRIGSARTDGSGNWLAFSQLGDEFLWLTGSQTTDVSTSSLSSTPVLYALRVPTGLKVTARIRTTVVNSAITISSPDEGAVVFNIPNGNQSTNTVTPAVNPTLDVRTNTSGQIQAVGSGATQSLVVVAYGWIDSRGRNG